MNSFSSIKDVDREILLKMSDKKLLKTCSLNKYLLNDVCDDNFFHRVLQLKYPDTLHYLSSFPISVENKKKNKIYKSYYLQVVYYVAKMKEKYHYSYISGNPKAQYEIFRDIDYKPDDINKIQQLLFTGSEKGELNLIKEALKQGVNISAANDYALRCASRNGHLEVVKYLIEKGGNIHIYNEEGLRMASLNGHLETAKYLVEKGADISADNEDALKFASRYGHLEIVKYLVEKGADFHNDNESALRSASLNGHLEVVKYLAEQGADISVNNDIAVRLANYNKHYEVVKYLVERGANVNARDEEAQELDEEDEDENYEDE
jgi:hypothetical protein